MNTFDNFNISKQLLNAITELGFEKPTPVQIESFPVILSGKDVVGIAQTGTGKTLAYMLPLLHELKYSNQINPRILILVPTRELVIQLVEMIESFTKYQNVRILGVYGGTNIKTQKEAIVKGTDILVATPGRLYDLALTKVLQLKEIKKLVIDEVDIMLDLGFRYQLTNIFEILPTKRQNIMFSATMTDEVAELIENTFTVPKKIQIAISGTPLDNISQKSYKVENFYTKINFLIELLRDKDEYTKVIVFVSSKKLADIIHEKIEPIFGNECSVIHSNKSQNYRIRSMKAFDKGKNRILIASDVMARGLDFETISHVINMDTPKYPENYIHRIGRTGRANKEGQTLLFYTNKEVDLKIAIEKLMNLKISEIEFPVDIEISKQLLPEERKKPKESNYNRNIKKKIEVGASFHEKKQKNQKTNQGGSYLRKAKKHKKAQTRGDKTFNLRNKKKK